MAIWFWISLLFLLLIPIIYIIPFIILIIKNVQFISSLYRCAQLTGDPNLNEAHKMEKYALFLSILCIVFGLVLILFLWIGLLLIIVPFILKIISSISIEKWSHVFDNTQSYAVNDITKNAELIKIGAILSIVPFINIIGSIVYFVGVHKMGNCLLLRFGTQMQLPLYSYQMHPDYITYPSVMPSTSSIPHVEGFSTYTTDQSPSLHQRTDRPKTHQPTTDRNNDAWQQSPRHHNSNVIPQQTNVPPMIDPYNQHNQYNQNVSRLPMQKICSKCSKLNLVDAKFCANCGFPFVQEI